MSDGIDLPFLKGEAAVFIQTPLLRVSSWCQAQSIPDGDGGPAVTWKGREASREAECPGPACEVPGMGCFLRASTQGTVLSSAPLPPQPLGFPEGQC